MKEIFFKYHLLAVLIITVLSVIVYSNTFNVPFYYDDRPVIIENPNIKDIRNISNVLFHNPSRPLFSLSLALNYYLNGLNPFGYHLVNLFFHVLSGLLVYILTFLIFKNLPAFFGASFYPFYLSSLFSGLIFSAHPIQTESVTYISSRSGVMCTSFYLLSIIFFIKYLKSTKIKYFFYLLSILSFLVSLGIKETAVTLPAILLLVDYFFLSKKPNRENLLSEKSLSAESITGVLKKKWYHIPFWLLILVIFIIRYFLYGTVGHPKFHRNLIYHLLTQSHVIINYFRLLFLPFNLTIDYVFPIYKDIFEPLTALCIIIIFLILIFSFKNINKSPVLSFSVLWFFITLSPTSLIPLEDSMSERWLYLPSIGFCLFMVFILKPFFGKERITKFSPFLILSIILLLFAANSYQRNIIWQSEYTLWKDALAKTGNKARPYLALGYLNFKNGNYRKAIDYYKKSIELYPTAEAYNNLAYALTKLKTSNDTAVIQLLKESISLKPGNYKAYLNIGDIYFIKKDYNEALKYYQKALDVNPKFSAAHLGIGIIDERLGRTSAALERYRTALKFDPLNREALYSLGTLYLNTAQYVNAIITLERLISLSANNPDVYYNLGLCYYYIGDYKKAMEAYQQSLKINPYKADVHNSMGVSLLMMGEVDRAMEEYAVTIRIDPKFAQAYGNMGLVYKQMGEKDKAIAMFKEALKFDPDNQSTKENLRELGSK